LKKALGLLAGARPADAQGFRHRPARVPTGLRARWAAVGAGGEGVLANISSTGCYVSGAHDLAVGDAVEVELTLPGRLTVPLKGLVARVKEGEGFGLRFRGLSATERLLLERAVWHLSSMLEHNRPIRERITRGRAGSAA
jgi:hypothetical protein